MPNSAPKWIPPERTFPDFAIMSYFILSLFTIMSVPVLIWYHVLEDAEDDRITYRSSTQECFIGNKTLSCTEEIMMRASVLPE